MSDADDLIRRLARFYDHGVERVHTFAGGGEIALGADWDAADAEAFIRSADRIGPENFIGHVLVVGSDGRARYFDTKPGQ